MRVLQYVSADGRNGVAVLDLNLPQTKQIVHMIMKFAPKCEQGRKFKKSMNEQMLCCLLQLIKNEVDDVNMILVGEIGALIFYECISTYTDADTEFTRTLIAQVHNLIPNPLDEVTKSFF